MPALHFAAPFRDRLGFRGNMGGALSPRCALQGSPPAAALRLLKTLEPERMPYALSGFSPQTPHFPSMPRGRSTRALPLRGATLRSAVLAVRASVLAARHAIRTGCPGLHWGEKTYCTKFTPSLFGLQGFGRRGVTAAKARTLKPLMLRASTAGGVIASAARHTRLAQGVSSVAHCSGSCLAPPPR